MVRRKGIPDGQDSKTGEFVRAVTLPDDSELLTRHEVQTAPPDLLLTNYSMLEYMLMRPIERPIFDRTREWLRKNLSEKFLVVLDEAHLYRGAAGAEVGLLLRRLRDRLGRLRRAAFRSFARLRASRITLCASIRRADCRLAPGTFIAVRGSSICVTPAATGSKQDAEVLAAIELTNFYDGGGR